MMPDIPDAASVQTLQGGLVQSRPVTTEKVKHIFLVLHGADNLIDINNHSRKQILKRITTNQSCINRL